MKYQKKIESKIELEYVVDYARRIEYGRLLKRKMRSAAEYIRIP